MLGAEPLIPALYGFLAASSAVSCEVFYHTHSGVRWGLGLWPGLVLALLTNFGIWGVLQYESPLGLAVTFSLWTATLRIAYVLVSGGKVNAVVWVAFALVVFASLLKAVWSV